MPRWRKRVRIFLGIRSRPISAGLERVPRRAPPGGGSRAAKARIPGSPPRAGRDCIAGPQSATAGRQGACGTRPGLRVRVGDYRIIYTVTDDVLLVVVVTLEHRHEVYER
ncbi:MAG TPA: type II toxin-antitoxin system RelE/ParE family toxin [Nakamurella sp.]